MSCWCGHGPWHHRMYPYPPPYPTPGYPPPGYYGPPPERPRRGTADVDDLANALGRLEEELARIRRDLDELRGSGASER